MHLLLGTCLSGYVLEGDAQVATLLVHLGLRLAYVEDACATYAGSTTAHAAHEEHPYEDDAGKEQHVHQQRTEELVALGIVVRELAAELLLFAGLVHKLLYLVHRTDGHCHRGTLACLLHALVEHVADVFRLDIHLQRVAVFVDYYLVGIALHDHHLEVRVRCLRLYARLLTALREVE